MKVVQVLLLSLVCLTNIAWLWNDNPKVQKNMDKGQQAWQAGNRTEAMNYYQAALALKPNHVDALNSLGVIYEEVGLTAKAEEKYLTAIKLNDKFLPAYSNLALLYWNQENMDKAVYYFQKRADLGSPQDPWTKRAQKAVANIKSSSGVDRQLDIHQDMEQLSSHSAVGAALDAHQDNGRGEIVNQVLDQHNAPAHAALDGMQTQLKQPQETLHIETDPIEVKKIAPPNRELPTLKEWLYGSHV